MKLFLSFLFTAFVFVSVLPAHAQESAYERIIKTKTLRCGYVNYPPLLKKDPNSGEFTGIGVDVMKRAAELMQVNIEWAEETSWATYIEGLQTNRFDALCTMDFYLPAYVGKVELTSPLFFTGIGIYKRPDDERFPLGYKDFDRADVSISAIDGSLSMMIKNSDFPKAKLISMPNMTDYTFILSNVVSKKADITFVERSVANDFLKKNPGALVNISEENPLRIYPYFIPVKFGETGLKSVFDGIIALMINNGEIEKILKAHEGDQQSFYRVSPQYTGK